MLQSLEDGPQGPNGNLEDSLQSELDLMLRAHRTRQIIGRERDLNIYRSGSAPPTVEGSLSAVGSLYRNFGERNSVNNSSSSSSSGCRSSNNNGILSEDEMRSHPAYLSYYYTNDNINPRLPPPLLSKEDWRVAQRFQAVGSSYGGIGDRIRKKSVGDGDSSSLFAMQPGFSPQKAENDLMDLRNAGGRNLSRQASAEWFDRDSDGLTGLSSDGLGARRKSFADILQEGLDRPAPLSGHSSRPASRNAIGDIVDMTGISDPHSAELCDGVESLEGLYSGAAPPGLVGVQSHTHSFATAVGSSLSRSTTPEAQLVGRSPGSCLPPVGSKAGPVEKKNAVGTTVQNGYSSGMFEPAEIAAALSGLSLSKLRHADEDNVVQSQCHVDLENRPDFLFNMPNGHNHSLQQQLREKSSAENLPFSNNYTDLSRKNGIVTDLNASKISYDGKLNLPKRTNSSASLYSNYNSSGFGSLEGSKLYRQNPNVPSMDAYSVKQKLHSVTRNHLDAALHGGEDGQRLNRLGNQIGPDLSPVMDPRYIQYLHRTSDNTVHAASLADPSQFSDYFGTSHGDLDELQKVYLETLLTQQKQQYELPLLGNYGGLSHGYYGNPSYGMTYPGNPMANSVHPSLGPGSFQNDRVSRFTSMMRNSMGGSVGSWHSDIGSNMEGRFTSSLLDEFKNNKTKSIELSDIVGHVVEFSTDQYGSRFIQQKLETALVEEKTNIFPELIPHARTLMTDVFGNYVIQKFFEHGTESQRKELASQLTGHVLPLSLQMYGCRVIQKALEVVDVNQQTEMVAELDGSVMKCVHDQNGNHVIQKCIECVPQDRIQFIISSFYGQVIALSTHPYGCRVIQRVLEHCDDLNTQEIVMDEIMQSVCILAQDQYGNYVIQHILEHGKPHERTAIIRQLAGQIVKMSQQKFASNVVEKCLTFGGPEERQLLVNEMLGSTDENEPLQAMMKDPFGNYVVQKVLETCDDLSLQLILSRIKVHLNALKRYTYGKHIVSRVEKLITTGERRIGLSSSFSS